MTYLIDHIKTHCVGCKACYSICPKKCIEMKEDEEGFAYPEIHEDECVNCHLCEKVCPENYNDFYKSSEVEAYVGIHESKDVVFRSSSGGAFTAIYESLISQGYIVFGVRFTEELKVIHDFAQTIEQCEAFRKSKYVYSDTNNCYQKISDFLLNGKKVLFSGVPCQCAALHNYLATKKINTDNLITVSLICHGAPNQKIFDSYIAESGIRSFVFKNKTPINGRVNSRTAYISFLSGEEMAVDMRNDSYLKGYYTQLFYRPSCGSCRFARKDRTSDITIGDAWNIEKIHPEYNPYNGVSLILASTGKGKKIISNLNSLNLIHVDSTWAFNSQRVLRKPTNMNKKRDKFFSLWNKKGFKYAVNKATKRPLYRKVGSRIKRVIKRIF